MILQETRREFEKKESAAAYKLKLFEKRRYFENLEKAKQAELKD